MISIGKKPITSILFILFVTLLHFIETYLLAARITVADWIFPMRAFLFVCGGNHIIAAVSLGACSLSGLGAFILKEINYHIRIIMFMAQSLPVILAALWIIGCALINLDAYGGHQSTLALLLNQAPRISWIIAYPVAVISVINRR